VEHGIHERRAHVALRAPHLRRLHVSYVSQLRRFHVSHVSQLRRLHVSYVTVAWSVCCDAAAACSCHQ
jgi:hypothetical protein